MGDQKNLVLFIIVFLAVMFGWNYFYEAPRHQNAPVASQTTQATAPTQTVVAPVAREEAVNGSARVKIDTPSLQGSINLKGGVIDDLLLKKYFQTTEDEKNIELLSPLNSKDPYLAEFGWATTDKDIALPDENTVWSAKEDLLTDSGDVVTLTWDNGQGVVFERHFSVDKDYMFKVQQTIVNNSGRELRLFPFSQVRRVGTPPVQGYMLLHEGPIGYVANSLKEHDYTDLQEKPEMRTSSQGGWIGITDKYWLAAAIPAQDTNSEFYFRDERNGPQDQYVSGFFGQEVIVASGDKGHTVSNIFAGAKVLELLDGYEASLNIKHFDLAVDFGRFYFITKPLFYGLEMIYKYVGNFGIAILILTVLIKLLFFPLANKSYRSMARMKELQPKMEKLKERYADDKMKMNQELMDLYKKEKVNPAAGCLPILIQIPVFFALYKVLFVTIEMRHAPFYGWIEDLSAPDPTTVFNLFGLLPFTPPSFLMIGILPILMGASMWVQQRLNPAPTDPIQQKMFMFMPIMLTFLLAQFPAGLVLYWTWNNLLSIGQQWVIMQNATAKKL